MIKHVKLGAFLLAIYPLILPMTLLAQRPVIYGYLSKFPSQSSATSSNTIAWMAKYHINYVQFYDWQWKQHIPLAGTVQSPAASWSDIANRTIYRQTVMDMIDACHANGMLAMNYNLLYGAYGNYQSDGSGVSSQWGLYNSPGGSQWTVGLPASWAGGSGALAMFNPANTNWQNYLFNRENDVFAAYSGFDGWHVDQLGDFGVKYDSSGAALDVWNTFAGFLNNAKAATGKRIVFNNVGAYGMFSTCSQVDADAVYVECWEGNGQATYNDLKATIDNGIAWSGGKSVVLAAYMNRGKGSGNFGIPGVLLTDATIFASGGTHLELGDDGKMLCNEYFPNVNVTMSAALADTLKDYYDFIITYQDYLYGGFTNSGNAISLSIASTNVAAPQKVWAFAKVKNGQHMLNLINLVGENSINWRDDLGNYPVPTAQANFTAKYYYGSGTPASVQVASPDINHGGTFQNLSFTTGSDGGGNYVSFTVPSLAYWDLILINTAAPTVPAAPANLVATPGNAQATLSWNASMGATSYNVKRATVNGGPYGTITNVTATSFVDPGLVNGATYYYVVSAANSAGESANSTQVSVTPVSSGLPSPWVTADVGAVGLAGNATYSGGTFTVTGSGVDIEGTADEFRYVYQAANGDCEIRVRLATIQNTDPWAKAGVMIRETTAAGSRNATLVITPGNGVNFQRRTTTGGATTSTTVAGVTAPRWLRLVRTANSFTAFYSADGVAWTQVGTSQSITMASSVTLGLAVTAHNDTVLCTATMDSVSTGGIPAAPTGLTATAGNAQVSLSWAASSGATSYNVKRATVSGGPYTTITNVTTTSFVNTDLVNGTTYYYVVSALNASGESANSSQASATPSVPTPPATPTGLNATAGNAQVSLSWNTSSGATSYNVKRATVSGGPYTTITNVTTVSFINAGLVNGTTYYYVVSALNAAGESANSTQASATPQLPPPGTPTGLTATAGNAQVVLGWTASSGATSYNVKRATVSGGPYTTVTNVTSTSCTDIGLVNGTTYYYVASALNTSGESANSSQASATPSAGGLPSPWVTADIGAVGATGSASYNSGTFTVIGSGADIEGTSDEFRYVYQTSSGDCSIVARVATQQSTDPWAKAGVMIRQTTAAGSRCAGVFITPGNGVTFQRRTSTGGGTIATTISGVTAPRWVKLTRTSNTFRADYSADGVNWTQVGANVSISMGTSTTLGLAVTSHNDGVLCTSAMDGVTATP